MLCVSAKSSLLDGDPRSMARIGKGDSASQSGFKCATGPNVVLYSYKVGSRKIFPIPLFLTHSSD